MKKVILLAAVLLGACSHSVERVEVQKIVPAPERAPKVVERTVEAPAEPRVQVPALPNAFREPVAKLPPLRDGTLKGVMRDGAKTDSLYNDLRSRYGALAKFYDCVREAVNGGNADAIKKCSE